MQIVSINVQAIERSGTGITYLQLLMSMSQALEQLSAQQGKLPPKLPTEVGGMFGGLLNKLVTLPTQTGSPLNAQPCLSISENGEISAQALPQTSNSCMIMRPTQLTRGYLAGTVLGNMLSRCCKRHVCTGHYLHVLCMGLQMDGAMDMAGLSAQTPVLSCNYPFDLNRPLAI